MDRLRWERKKKQMGIFLFGIHKPSQVAFRSEMIYKNLDKKEMLHSLELST